MANEPTRSYPSSAWNALLHLSRAQILAQQHAQMRKLLYIASQCNPFYQRKLAGIDLETPGLDVLGQLPFTTRAELHADQLAHPPYGSNLSQPVESYRRVHQTSGTHGRPLYWLDTAAGWRWFKDCWTCVFAAAEVSERDVVAFTFSFGPFVGFWAAFEAAQDLRCRVLPAGGMSSSARIQHILTHGATVLCCTPTYALHLIDAAERDGVDLRASPVRVIVVAGEPGGSVPGTRARIENGWGARVIDHAGMTELGAWGVELFEQPGGLHVLEHRFIAEVIDPQTLEPVPDGTPGELVMTNLGRVDSPLIRYRTGDIVRLEPSPAEGVNFRWAPGGVVGRVDDMLVIRGNNVFPSAIESIVRRVPEIAEFRLSVKGEGGLVDLLIEIEAAPAPGADELKLGQQAATRLTTLIRDELHFRPEVHVVPANTLPRFEFKAKRVQRDAGT